MSKRKQGGRKHTLVGALNALARAGVRRFGKVLYPAGKDVYIGIKTWGLIDFLCSKENGYEFQWKRPKELRTWEASE
jgi:hypothetical protein